MAAGTDQEYDVEIGDVVMGANATVAVAAQVSVDRLWHPVPRFPTVSELWLRLLEAHRDAADDN